MSSHSARRTQLTWLLVCVFLLLAGVIAWMEFGSQSSSSHSAQAINRIVVTRAGHDPLELVRTENDWQITKPYLIKANTQRVEPLLSVGAASFEGYATSEVDMQAAGLEAPRASLTFNKRKFSLGTADASGERRYALVDEQVGFVPEWVWSLLHGGVTAFADLNVFDELPDSVHVHSGDSVQKAGNIDQWRSLQADKIVAWPDYRDKLASESARGKIFTLNSSADITDDNQIAEVIEFDEATLINTSPGFAYAISNERMRELLQQ